MEPVSEAKPKAKDDKPKADLWNSLLNNVLKNPFIWGMALTYFFVYVVRQVRPRRTVCTFLPFPYVAVCGQILAPAAGRVQTSLTARCPPFICFCKLLRTALLNRSDAAVQPSCRRARAPERSMAYQSIPPYCLTPQGVTSWFVFYLIKEKGIEDAAQVGWWDQALPADPKPLPTWSCPQVQ